MLVSPQACLLAADSTVISPRDYNFNTNLMLRDLNQMPTDSHTIFLHVFLSLKGLKCLINCCYITNISHWPGDTIWGHISGSTLAPVMACCLITPSHALSQHWLTITWSCGIHLKEISQQMLKIYLLGILNYWFKITVISPGNQWVKQVVLKSGWLPIKILLFAGLSSHSEMVQCNRKSHPI